MNSVLVIGAGSIGNHLSYACRQKGWSVDLYDNDPAALTRTSEEIYPSRYGQWDEGIRLLPEDSFKSHYDLAIVGTPPDTHLQIAGDLLARVDLRYLLIEKPLCGPKLGGLDAFSLQVESSGCNVLVGYNHIFTKNTSLTEGIIKRESFGAPLSLHVRWLEHWGGIFAAHPWLSGPEASYLGHWARGGGACGEHSHAISLWQYFSTYLGMGKISSVTSTMKMVDDGSVEYDETAHLLVESERGLVGSIIQDVVTAPAEKTMRIQFQKGFIEWRANFDSTHDAVLYAVEGKSEQLELIEKKRTDDFSGQIDHIEAPLSGSKKFDQSPNTLAEGISVMNTISKAHESRQTGKAVDIE